MAKKQKQYAGINRVKVLLDHRNDTITTKSGLRLYVDDTYEREKHQVITGTVEALPLQMKDGEQCELQIGDRVVMYYLSVINMLAKERKEYLRDEKGVHVFVKYNNIYTRIRDGQTSAVGKYILVEPHENPAHTKMLERMKAKGLDIPDNMMGTPQDNISAVYGRIAYVNQSEEKLKPGQIVVMKKLRDVPQEYEYHAKTDKGRKLYRVQKEDILATI